MVEMKRGIETLVDSHLMDRPKSVTTGFWAYTAIHGQPREPDILLHLRTHQQMAHTMGRQR